ncbi:MAG: hypothetical protein IJ733_16295 [Lachnospiraceae bacterium]|nr:hypothetical protein [Lachnospiraceae bacterium]
MHFMIDYENVTSLGFQGKEYLTEKDYVTIFYSAAVQMIERGIWQGLCASGCTISVCKLVKTGKNGLDFYIASRVGEIIAEGYRDLVVIISKDKGFKAVQDYWRCRGHHCARILLCKDIASGINSSNEKSERYLDSVRNVEKVSIGKEYEKYKKEQELYQKVKEIFKDTSFSDFAEDIGNILNRDLKKKEIYIEFLKTFGAKNGLVIYRTVKEKFGNEW